MENLALRHQIGVLRRSAKGRPQLTAADRFLWAWLCGVWRNWRSALVIVKPETVVAWHRKGFRLFWTWKVRHGKSGRPKVPKETRELIRRMSRESPIWGAPRFYGEFLKLGIDIGETSVSKYMVRQPKPPSQTWRTFLDNHIKSLQRNQFVWSPEIVRDLLSSDPHPPRAGQGYARVAARAAAGLGAGDCHSPGRRTSPPLRTACCLKVVELHPGSVGDKLRLHPPSFLASTAGSQPQSNHVAIHNAKNGAWRYLTPQVAACGSPVTSIRRCHY